jgi:quinol monooxygenase YgiN
MEEMMSTTVMLEFKAKQGLGNGLLATLKDILPDTRSYEGNQSITVYQKQDDPDTCIIQGVWDSVGHYEKYIAWREETGVLAAFVDQLEGPPSIRYFNKTDA